MKSCCKEVVNNSELAQHMPQGPYMKVKHIKASINILPFWNELLRLLVMRLPKNTNARLYFVHFSTSISPVVHQVVCKLAVGNMFRGARPRG